MVIAVEPNGSRYKLPCQICDEVFELVDPQPVAFRDTGERLGDICLECFQAAKKDGAAGLMGCNAEKADVAADQASKRTSLLILETIWECNYFGICPNCGGCDGYLNVGRNHWNVCHKCKVKWWVGSNLFSSWREETEEQWQENDAKLASYAEVDEADCQCVDCQRKARSIESPDACVISDDSLPF